jgi:hypothetical protein
MGIEEVNMKQFREMREQKFRGYAEWEEQMKVKRCKCGNPYSYDPARQSDPKCCAECGGREGDIVW